MNWKYSVTARCPWEKIIVFDTETTRIKDENFAHERFSPKMIFAVCYDGARFYRFYEGQEDKIRLFCAQKAKEGYVFVAHNLEFDLLKLTPNVFKDAEEVLFRNKILSASFLWHGALVRWVDSMNILATSVEQIGLMLGRPKRKDLIDYNKYIQGYVPTEDDWKYCEEDCAIVYDGIKFLHEHITALGGILKLTLASTAFSMAIPNITIATKHADKEVYYMKLSELGQDIGLLAYKGGMTRAIIKGDHTNMAYYDINSAYPFAMTKDFPDPRFCDELVKPSDEQVKALLDYYEGFAKIRACTYNINHPYIACKGKDGLAYYPKAQLFETTISYPELRYLLDHPNDYKFWVDSIYYMHRIPSPFKQFVEKLYEAKEDAGRRNHPGERWIYKIILNSCYGKFAQQDEDLLYIADTELVMYNKRQQIQDPDLYKEWEDNFIEHMHWTDKEYTEGFHKTDKTPSSHAIFSWASYITAYARVQLWPHLEDAVYCDTDSIFIPRSYQGIDIGPQLGQWKYEADLAIVKVRGKKWYEYLTTGGQRVIKIKGVDLRDHPEATVDDEEYLYYRMLKSRGTIRSREVAGDFVLQIKHLADHDDECFPEQ